MKIYVQALAVVAVFGLVGWWQVYKYNDCKHVGLAGLYCFMSIGK